MGGCESPISSGTIIGEQLIARWPREKGWADACDKLETFGRAFRRGRETRAEFAGLTLLAEVALLAQVGGGRYTSAGLRENQIFACITKSVVRWNLPSRSVE